MYKLKSLVKNTILIIRLEDRKMEEELIDLSTELLDQVYDGVFFSF
jgi:hypothetical protein